MYAIVVSGGKQFKIKKNSTIRVPSIDLPVGEKLRLEQILLFNNDGQVVVGKPFIEGAYAEARIVQHGRREKITIVKYKRRKDYRRKLGHKQGFTDIIIDSIVTDVKKKAVAKTAEKKVEKAKEVKVKAGEKKKPVAAAAKPEAAKKKPAAAARAKAEPKAAKPEAAKKKPAAAARAKAEPKAKAAKPKAAKKKPAAAAQEKSKAKAPKKPQE